MCTFVLCLPTIDLPEPIITIDTDGSGNAGKMYTLICIVYVQNGLVIPPLTEWLDSTGTVLISANGIRLNMTFNPLNTSNGGRYTCRSTVNIPDAEVNYLSSIKTVDVIVEGLLRSCVQYREIVNNIPFLSLTSCSSTIHHFQYLFHPAQHRSAICWCQLHSDLHSGAKCSSGHNSQCLPAVG